MDNKQILLLVGGGHAHVYFIKEYATNKIDGFKVVLVSTNKKQYYSGMASSYIEGIYNEDNYTFDLQVLCQKSGIEFIQDTIIRIDAHTKIAYTKAGQKIPFYALSLDIGSDILGGDIKGVKDNAITIKPFTNLKKIRNHIIDDNEDKNIIIVGGGVAGVELALAIKTQMNILSKPSDIKIINASKNILKDYVSGVAKKVNKILRKNNINIMHNQRITCVDKDSITTNNSKQIPYDMLIWATGVKANPMIKSSNLKTDIKGFMLVNKQLQSIDCPFIFGVGDCVSFNDYDYVKKVGVYAIREAPVLWDNIVSYLKNTELKEFSPQRQFMSIISMGDKLGIPYYKRIIISGKIAWYIKRHYRI